MVETLKQRLQRGEFVRVMGVGRVLHVNVVRAIGLSGDYHGLWIDLEHVGNAIENVEIATAAARSVGMDTFCRIAPTDYATVTRCLEAGASGVMAAQIHSAEQADQFVRWAKFHPRGQRGLNVGGWDGEYGRVPIPEFLRRANEQSMVLIQIETEQAVREVDAIAGIDGVDGLFVGPSDLSQALGVPGEFLHDRCLRAIDGVSQACAKHGKFWGAVSGGPEHAAVLVEKGLRMLSPTSDVKTFGAGLNAIRQQYRDLFDNPGGTT